MDETAKKKGSGGESKKDSLPLLSFAFCFFRLYALPFGMVRVAGFRMPQVERWVEWYAFCAFLLCLLIGTMISSCGTSILFQCFHDAIAEFHVIVVSEKQHLIA